MPREKHPTHAPEHGGTILSFGEAYANFWTKYFRFTGVAVRSEFWWTILANMLLCALLAAVFNFNMYTGLPMLILLIPTLSQWARRYHDIGMSGWLVLLSFVPVVDLVMFLLLGFLPTNYVHPNRFRDLRTN
ncbi:MAG: DUF805 domain-containing protein [Proteobacteria bacterium]|nr:DUF805 domain-containing protein [Pseudomonadota bacterium]